jgi:hypothetical protein
LSGKRGGDLLVGTPTGLFRIDRLAVEPLLERFRGVGGGSVGREIWVGGPTGTVRSLKGGTPVELGAAVHRLRGEEAGLIAAGDDGLWVIRPDGGAEGGADRTLAAVFRTVHHRLASSPGGEVLVGGLNRGLALLNPAHRRASGRAG